VVWVEKNKRYQFHSQSEKDAEIERLEAEIAVPSLPPLSPFGLKVGQIGSLRAPEYRVGLITTYYRVAQIISKDRAMIIASTKIGDFVAEFFLVGPSVEELQEDQEATELPGVYIVEKKERYTALAGVHTLHVLRSYDLKPHLAKLKKKSP